MIHYMLDTGSTVWENISGVPIVIVDTTAAFTTGLETKLNGIDTAANANPQFSIVGTANTRAGLNAGRVATGSSWTATGANAGYFNTTGINWTATGAYAGYANTTGNYWTAIGRSAGYSNTTGSNWMAIGMTAGYSNTTGSDWVATGVNAGYANTTGINWTAIGRSAGYSNTTGSNWMAIGMNAGRYLPDGTTGATVFDACTYVGYNTKVSSNTSGLTNENVFGNFAEGKGSNTVSIGKAVTHVYINGSPVTPTKTPASAIATGVAGEMAWDASYIYMCISTNVWKRSPLTTW